MRVALSQAASENLSEVRLRRLIDIELADAAQVSPRATGPLGDHLAFVWIDRPTPSRLEIQVRLDARPVVRRGIVISGVTADVAARLVAIAASEIIQVEIRRMRAPRRPPPPRPPSPEELERAARDRDALDFGAGPEAAWLPAAPALLAGPSLEVGIRRLRVDQLLFARWLGAPLHDGTLRWAEAGVAADYRVWLGPSLRLTLGASAAIASLRLGGASAVDDIADEEDTWSARAGARIGVDGRIGGPVWIGLHLEPGAILRPVPYRDAAGVARSLEGAWLGLGLTLAVEAQPSAK